MLVPVIYNLGTVSYPQAGSELPLAEASQFIANPEEVPPMANCKLCVQHCDGCTSCYKPPSPIYDPAFDQCPSLQPEDCDWSRCTQQCPQYLYAGGFEGLLDGRVACLDENVGGMKLYQPPGFCAYRDPAVPTIAGRDAWGLAKGRKPPSIYLPSDYDPSKKYPLLLWFCGRGTCANFCMNFHGLRYLSYKAGVIFMSPDGTDDADGSRRFCPPIDAQSDESCAGSDDARYVWSLVEEAKHKYSISDIFVSGWSNGAAFAATMACYYSDEITAAVIMSGGNGHLPVVPDHPTYKTGCTQQAKGAKIHVLHVHDISDLVVSYSNAIANLEDFGLWNGCDLSECPAKLEGGLDLLPLSKGRYGSFYLKTLSDLGLFNIHREENETLRWAFGGCDAGGSSEMWTVRSLGSERDWWQPSGPTDSMLGMPSGAFGHVMGWGQANDAGQSQQFGARILEWMLEKAEEGHARRGRRMPMFAARNLSSTDTASCPHWTEYEGAGAASMAAYTIVLLTGPLTLLCALCVCHRARSEEKAEKSQPAQVKDGAVDPRARDKAEEQAIKQSAKTSAQAKEKQNRAKGPPKPFLKGTAMM